MIRLLKSVDRFIAGKPFVLRWALRIIGSILLVCLSGFIRAMLPFAILPYLLFVPAIMASAFFFGMLGGTCAVTVATLIAVYFFLPPENGLVIADAAQGLAVGLFYFVTLAIAYVCSTLRRSLLRIERDKEGLEARVTAEVEKRSRTEDALRQSQKMEAVGQLSGGLAHDFNNLLTGITGSLDLLASRIRSGRTQGLERYIETAQSSADRAAALTHRLLAFSRRQTLEPKVVDPHKLVQGMTEMLRRTLGPSTDLRIELPDRPWLLLVDPNQLENALLNLCLNARDAMAPNGGRIVIATANLSLDGAAAGERGLASGDYLAVTVSDSGCGIASDIVERVFEPFFTTKPLGSGTGLGLSMVYGFAKQSGGSVKLHSALGSGTKVCLLLPRHIGTMKSEISSSKPINTAMPATRETILIVDDEPAILMLVEETFADIGYQTITASTGAAGLEVLRSDAQVDLLISDVGLPGGMNGRQMADAGRLLRPSLPVVFITGYAETSVLSDGILDAGMAIVTKPFNLDELAIRVRTILG